MGVTSSGGKGCIFPSRLVSSVSGLHSRVLQVVGFESPLYSWHCLPVARSPQLSLSGYSAVGEGWMGQMKRFLPVVLFFLLSLDPVSTDYLGWNGFCFFSSSFDICLVEYESARWAMRVGWADSCARGVLCSVPAGFRHSDFVVLFLWPGLSLSVCPRTDGCLCPRCWSAHWDCTPALHCYHAPWGPQPAPGCPLLLSLSFFLPFCLHCLLK